jgi:hypothetical protein
MISTRLREDKNLRKAVKVIEKNFLVQYDPYFTSYSLYNDPQTLISCGQFTLDTQCVFLYNSAPKKGILIILIILYQGEIPVGRYLCEGRQLRPFHGEYLPNPKQTKGGGRWKYHRLLKNG